jgi:hypothetical protein
LYLIVTDSNFILLQELGGDQQHKMRELYQSYFYGRQDQYWADTAMDKLPPLLDASNMMVCAEKSLVKAKRALQTSHGHAPRTARRVQHDCLRRRP